MLKDKSSIEYIAVKNGLIAFGGLVAYFFLMKGVGLVHIVELRSLNFLIMVGGVWLAFREYKKSHSEGLAYFNGLGLGIRTTVVSVVPFALFIFFYLKLDPAFMETIRANEMFGYHLNPYLLAFLIAFEGSLSGFFIAYTLMQYMKRKSVSGW
ncbi:MAG: DUF4199 family protein [Cytophagales bacterium]|nr:DUF4199 family protein [Cytophagales bacterium]